jgi:hypothetical protein
MAQASFIIKKQKTSYLFDKEEYDVLKGTQSLYFIDESI